MVIVDGEFAGQRGELRNTNCIALADSEHVESVYLVDLGCAKKLKMSQLRQLDARFNAVPDVLEVAIDGLKWPDNDFNDEDTKNVFDILTQFFKPKSVTTAHFYSNKTGEIFISRIQNMNEMNPAGEILEVIFFPKNGSK